LSAFLGTEPIPAHLLAPIAPPEDSTVEDMISLSARRKILVCTDLGSRGLDTTCVTHVVLFDFPTTAIDYLHRAGRTARAGSRGKVTAMPSFVSLDDFEKHAYARLDRNALDYYRSGAQDMITVRENQRAFDRIVVRPRVLRDVSTIDMQVTVQGQPISSPICIAPTAMQRMAHPEGECATARASVRKDTCMILSSWSTTSIEDVAASTPNSHAPKWLQLYIYKDREATKRLIERAQDSGYTAIALTVDTPFLGRRLADIRNRFQLPPHLTMANFSDQGKAQVGKADAASAADNASGLAAYVASQIDPTLSWKHVQWVKSVARIPVLVKGILTAEDARLAVDAGVDGIIVSNHGGRQIDTAPATIDVLEE
ncbi:Hydroxyacid oxidase 1, partial [Coemansia sp. RSA 353]